MSSCGWLVCLQKWEAWHIAPISTADPAPAWRLVGVGRTEVREAKWSAQGHTARQVAEVWDQKSGQVSFLPVTQRLGLEERGIGRESVEGEGVHG